MEEREISKHPSFGQIRFSHINGHANFYGSELEQTHYITMEVVESEVHRDLSQEWYFGHGVPLISIRMTGNQFSEMITSMNMGSGIPCTIEMINGKKVDPLPVQESRKEFMHKKFKDRMKMFADTIREKQQRAKELIKKKTLSKADIHELDHTLNWLTTEIESNIPFFAQCFQETADEIVKEAKTEVENAILHKIQVLGLTELHNQQKLLNNSHETL